MTDATTEAQKITTPEPMEFSAMDRYKWLLRQKHDHKTVLGGRCDNFSPTAAMQTKSSPLPTAVVWCDECGVVLDRKTSFPDDDEDNGGDA